MIYIDLTFNLALLVALSIVSGFIDRRWSRATLHGSLLQGVLFGATAVIGMMRPLDLGPGLIFDGRSVMVSLCALFFGPWAAAVSVIMTIACRTGMGGAGTLTGSLVILSSAGIGLLARSRINPCAIPPSAGNLYIFGLAVHLAMMAMMFTLPGGAGFDVIKRIGLPVMMLYPLATILSGKILSDQVEAIRNMEALRESENKYRALVENAGETILVAQDGVIKYINRRCVDLVGYEPDELIGRPFGHFIHPEDRDMVLERYEKRLKDEILPKIYSFRVIDREELTRWVEINAVGIDWEGRPATLNFLIDITGRRQAEEASQHSDELFRISFDADAVGRTFTGPDGRLLRVNQRFCEMLGYTAEELSSLTFADITHPDDLEASRDCVRRMIAGERSAFRLEKRYIRRDGSVLWTTVTTTLLRDDKGKPLHFVTGIQDITDRKLAEEELLAKMDALQRFQDSVVGRELIMIELKKEINELLKLAGREEKYKIF